MTSQIPEKLYRVAQNNPIVYAHLTQYRNGLQSLEDAMVDCVCMLAEQSELLMNQNLALQMGQPVIIQTDEFADWKRTVVPLITANVPRANGEWFPTHIWRLRAPVCAVCRHRSPVENSSVCEGCRIR